MSTHSQDSSAPFSKIQAEQSRLPRRGFLAKLAQTVALSPIAVAATTSGEASGVELSSSQFRQEFECLKCNREALEHLLLMSEMMQVWFRVHGDGIREFYSNEAGRDGYDIFLEGFFSGREVQRTAGIQLNQNLIRQFAEQCKLSSGKAAK